MLFAGCARPCPLQSRAKLVRTFSLGMPSFVWPHQTLPSLSYLSFILYCAFVLTLSPEKLVLLSVQPGCLPG